MATIQIKIDDETKTEADSLFSSLGLDTSTAVKIFLNAAIEKGGIPFAVKHHKYKMTAELKEAIEDSLNLRNLIGPFKTAEEAVASMLED